MMDSDTLDTLAREARLVQMPGRCIRLRGRQPCDACMTACPHDLPFRDGSDDIVSPDALESCTGCGACVGACPTEALVLPGATLEIWIGQLSASSDTPSLTVACSAADHGGADIEVRCLRGWDSALALFALSYAPRRENLAIVTGPCDRCSEGAGTHRVVDWVAETDRALRCLGGTARIAHETVDFAHGEGPGAPGLDRRLFLKALKRTGRHALGAYARSRETRHRHDEWGSGQPGERRALALHAMEALTSALEHPEGCDFTSSRPGRLATIRPTVAFATCSLCADCSLFCPTGALEAGIVDNRWVLLLDQRRCVGCGVCASLCRTGALQLEQGALLAILDGRERILASIPAIACTRCGSPARGDTSHGVCVTCSAADRRFEGFY